MATGDKAKIGAAWSAMDAACEKKPSPKLYDSLSGAGIDPASCRVPTAHPNLNARNMYQPRTLEWWQWECLDNQRMLYKQQQANAKLATEAAKASSSVKPSPSSVKSSEGATTLTEKELKPAVEQAAYQPQTQFTTITPYQWSARAPRQSTLSPLYMPNVSIQPVEIRASTSTAIAATVAAVLGLGAIWYVASRRG